MLLMRGSPEMHYGNNYNKQEHAKQLKNFVSEKQLEDNEQLR